jgi:DNA N-6-adenine-methyltransferase (Dam)
MKKRKESVMDIPVVYFYRTIDFRAMRIGFTNDHVGRFSTHDSSGLIFVAAILGDGQSCGSVEKSIQKHFDYCPVAMGDSDSFFKYNEVIPYVTILLELDYATNRIELIPSCPILPWQMINPKDVMNRKYKYDEDHQGLLFATAKSKSSIRDSWQSPIELAETSKSALHGRIDLDPASCLEANRRIDATYIYNERINGLKQSWRGVKGLPDKPSHVFLNPPYSSKLLVAFITKLISEIECGNVEEAVTVTNLQSFVYASGELLQRNAKAHAVLNKRIKFHPPKGVSFGSPKHGTICSYFGKEPDEFKTAFRKTGSRILLPG